MGLVKTWKATCQDCPWIRLENMLTASGLAIRHNKSRNHTVIVLHNGNLVSTIAQHDMIAEQDQPPY
jgi:hypothetical protein